MDSPRNADARDSPRTQRTASMTLDLPHPLGPTTPTRSPGRGISVGSTKDLKPASLMWERRNLSFASSYNVQPQKVASWMKLPVREHSESSWEKPPKGAHSNRY